jgi:hypothetical protein
MDNRTLLRRLISPAGFAVVLLLFFLPFVTVSCGNETTLDATFTGIDMAGGGEPDLTGVVGGSPIDEDLERELFALFADDIDLQPLAVLAALAVLIGMASALLPDRRARHASATVLAVLAGTLLTAAIVGVRGRVDEALQAKASLLGEAVVPTAIQARYGFWLAGAVDCARRRAVARGAAASPRPSAAPARSTVLRE